MPTTQKPQSASAGRTQLNLINSSRLQALRKHSIAPETNRAPQSALPQAAKQSLQEDAETIRLRQLIEHRLKEIWANLPIGKQRSLFKIRYGVGFDELDQLPIQRVISILRIDLARR